MKAENTYPKKERFGKFTLNLNWLYECTTLSKEAFDEHLKILRDCNGAGWVSGEAKMYLITGKTNLVIHAYGISGSGHTYRSIVV